MAVMRSGWRVSQFQASAQALGMAGIVEPALLQASHIKPWACCESEAERLDVHNGLLLSVLWDAAFDKGLVTFEDDGTPRCAPDLSAEARTALRWSEPLRLSAQHCAQLAWHREKVFGMTADAPSLPMQGV
jgi:predicted restriction endonuclease